MILFFCGSYLAVHFLLYFALRRFFQLFVTERGILLYHLGSAFAFTGAAGYLAITTTSSDGWAWFVVAVMMHGIYSLSFLELWALADDSYSLRILASIEAAQDRSEQNLIGELSAIGVRKQKSRLNHLAELGLVRRVSDEEIALTGIGRGVVFCAKILLFLTNVKRHG